MFSTFLRDNARWLGAGMTLTLASSFGQTYFISIFADRIMADYGLTDGQWGLVYTVATLSSAAVLLFAGRFADQIPVGRLAAMIFIGFTTIAIGMAINENVYVLVFLIFGLRFCGQGMLSHLGMTAMGRWFRAHRGRAVAIAGLGYSLGEALLPRIAALLEPSLGWRNVWLIVAVVLAASFLPLVLWLARDERHPRGIGEAEQSPGRDGTHWTRARLLRHPVFWALVPGIIANSFIGTVVFFQVTHIGGVMGWSKVDMTAAYPAYAICTIIVALISGWLVDRVGPDRLLPVFLLPLGFGMLLIGPFAGLWSWFGALGMAGVTTGMAHALWGAFWAEIYGTRHLGAIKAVAAAFMVVGSAVGPGMTGLGIDLGMDFTLQAPWMTASVVLISGLNFWVLLRLPARSL